MIKDSNEPPTAAVHGFLVGAPFYEPETKSLPKLSRYWERTLDGLCGRNWGEFVYDQLAIVDSDVLDSRMRDMEGILVAFGEVDKSIARLLSLALAVDPSATSPVALLAKRAAMDITASINIAEELIAFRSTGLLYLARAHELETLTHQRMT